MQIQLPLDREKVRKEERARRRERARMDLWLKENTVPQNESVPLDRERVIVENAVPLDENEQRRERFREEGEQYLIRVVVLHLEKNLT